MSTKSTSILISPEYYLLAFWHFVLFFFFVVGVTFTDIFSFCIFSFPSNLRRKKWPTDTFGVFLPLKPRVLEQFFVAVLRSP